MARLQRRERRAAALRRDERVLQASEEAVPGRRSKPAKVPFAGAAPTQAEGAGARIVLGGTPAPLERTKECPVCHNAIDEAIDYTDCPFCKANDEAQAVESKLADKEYESLDLSEVRALLARARRDRHLGRLDDHRKALSEAADLLDTLVKQREEATQWVEKVREALAQTRRAGGKADRLERAESYFTLADSLHRAHQHGKAARHARKAWEIMSGADETVELDGDRCPSCKGPVAGAIAAGAKECPHCGALLPVRTAGEVAETALLEAEKSVRDTIATIRGQLKSGLVERDEEATQLLESAERYERAAQWGQALEVLKALQERFDRERAAAGPPEPGDQPPQGPPEGPT
jgi:DNA repair exonuclease SbcCD ATPase subunit